MVEYCFKKQNEAYHRLFGSEPTVGESVIVPGERSKSQQKAARKQRTGNPGPVSGQAKVVHGDTFVIGHERVRLRGIDAAELSQNCEDAKDFRYVAVLAACWPAVATRGKS
ncbi:hypothetical protein D8676_20840 [Mesorhizobium sp. YM1C-6-2]|nr:hypothetical protein D8676_20840 [Mesorhizobium sp. YM1C-6-2]